MSVINQMLRDLQQQKKDSEAAKPASLGTKKAGRVPYLPLPLVAGGATLALLFLAWWLSGALSGTLPEIGPESKPSTPREIVATEQEPVTEKITPAVDPDQLSKAEREAEPPVTLAASEPVVENVPAVAKGQPMPVVSVEKTPVVKPVAVTPAPVTPIASEPVVEKVPAVAKVQPVSVASVEKTPLVKPAAAKPMPVAKSSDSATIIPKLVKESSGVSAKTLSVQSNSEHIPSKVEVSPQKRLHPDALPGAIMNSSHKVVESNNIGRPARSQATTPYGMAEEAYLEGKWALAQERSGLAVKSLQDALRLYPGHLQARELLVEIFVKDGKAGEAMFLLAEGLEIAPDYIVFKEKYSRLLMDQGDFDAAIRVIMNGGLPTVQDDPEVHVLLASLYRRLGEPFLAAQTYRNLLVAWPQRGAFWVGLGGALEEQRLSEEAVVCYQKALKTKDLSPDLKHSAEKRLSLLN
ncbi:MAG: tetratricopeptide repeat protein [Desulfuromonadales bacterium]